MSEVFTFLSPIGTLYLKVSFGALTNITTSRIDSDLSNKSAYKPENADFSDKNALVKAEVTAWLKAYFAGNAAAPEFPFKLSGTPFGQKVYTELLKVGYGSFTTYGELAKKVCVGKPCAQAIGGAVGKNPLIIVVPCHRVLGKDGALTGFSCGLDKKIWLLRHEGIKFKI